MVETKKADIADYVWKEILCVMKKKYQKEKNTGESNV